MIANGDKIAGYLEDKREELIWALSLQDYTDADISRIFNGLGKVQVGRIITRKPSGWKPKWVKTI